MLRLLIEAPPAGSGQRIELRPASQLARFPVRADPAGQLQLVKRGIKRPIAHLQLLAGYLLEPLTDRPSVLRFERNDLEEQQVQRSLHEVRRLAHGRIV